MESPDRLARSLPKAEADAAKAELQGKITQLEAKLVESVPRGEAERLGAEIQGLQKELDASKSDDYSKTIDDLAKG